MRRLEGHSVYHFPGCPYCMRVRFALRDLELEADWVNINLDPSARRRLVEATGRATVPVLRIEGDDEPATWMPESADIVHHLYREYGDGRKPPLRLWILPAHIFVAIALILLALSQLL